MALLTDKRLLITGVLTEGSIAYSVAAAAQREGAEIVLSGFGRGLRITQRIAQRLPVPADVLELDVNEPEQIEAVAAALTALGHLDGVLHAIAFAPAGRARRALPVARPASRRSPRFRLRPSRSRRSPPALLPLLRAAPDGGSIVGLDFDASVAWPIYDWQGVAKAALESISRYLARDLGPQGIRCNLVAAGPLSTVAASNIEGFDVLAQAWLAQAPLGWDLHDATPVADACLFLLSHLARGHHRRDPARRRWRARDRRGGAARRRLRSPAPPGARPPPSG